MQLYGENIFFISLAVILVPAFILGYCEKPLKHYGMAATVFFVVMTMKDKPQALLYMLCFVWYEYILAQIFLRITTGEHGSRLAQDPYCNEWKCGDTGDYRHLIYDIQGGSDNH